MKKWIILTLCTMLTLATTACGNSSSSEERTGGGKEQIPNPFVECASLEEAAELAGFTLTVPDTIDGYADRHISVFENEMLQVIYTNDNEDSESEASSSEDTNYESKDLCIRKGTGSGDISGDYNDYSETSTIYADDLQITAKGNDGKVNVALWTDGDYSFALVAGKALTTHALQELVTKIK